MRNERWRALPSVGALVMVAAFLGVPSPAAARDEGGKRVTLHFSPQEGTHTTSPDIPPALLNGPVDLVLVDDRQGVDKDVIGEAIDDDATTPIRTASDVGAFAKKILLDNAAAWGLKVTPGADRVITVKLSRFFVSENLKAVGAMFGSEVRTLFSYSEHRRVLWEGSTTGTTHRYGKRNDENINEVLSDAIKEAYSDGLSDAGLARAVGGHPQPSSSAAASSPSASGGGGESSATGAVSPAQLLADLVGLKKQGFAADVLVQYVNQRTLSAELTAADLGKWKQAGMPPEVIKAALARSPGAGK